MELSLIPSFIVTDNRYVAAEQLIQQRGWTNIQVDQVLAMPSQFIGTLDEITAAMLARRELYGFSYYVIADKWMELLAPVVRQLRDQ